MKKRADGRYMSQIFIGRGEDGQRKYKSVYGKTRTELREKEAEILVQLGKGVDVLSRRDSFAQWADDWLRIKETESITEGQMANYRRAVSVWKAELDGYELEDIRADDVERLMVSMSSEDYARRTIELYRSTIRQILKRAVSRGILAVNPAEQIEIHVPGRKTVNRRALTDTEQSWIWETPHRAQHVAVIMMLSGLRRGELAALTWNDVDLKNKTITVNKVMEYSPNGAASLRLITKTAAGMRTVDIPQKLADYMTAMPRDSALVIHTAEGLVMTTSAWKKLWQSYMRILNKKYGQRTAKDLQPTSKPGPKVLDMTIPPITMHWLRHTFCTLMYLAGVDVVQACAQMGHADVATTLRIYTHLDAQHKRKSMDKLGAYLSDNQNRVSQNS